MRFVSIFSVSILVFASSLMTQSATAHEITFWETFALAEDRAKTLEQLVPGSEDYFFFHCLHWQNEKQLDAVDKMLPRWRKARGASERYKQIRVRQELLRYGDDPKRTLKFLTDELNLQFNHQRKIPAAEEKLPTQLDPKLINRQRLVAAALRRSGSSLKRFDDDGLPLLADASLNEFQRHELLKRLDHSDWPNLVDMIALDLKRKGSGGFGSLNIHRQLTTEQLEQLAQRKPDVARHETFVNEMLLRLKPSADVNWRIDAAEHEAWLDRMVDYVRTLPPAFNSLKASVLYQRLQFDWKLGKPNRKLFLEYVQLPRSVPYIRRELLQDRQRREPIANLNEDYSKFISMPPVGSDRKLITDYLQHFLSTADRLDAFAPFFEDRFLKRQFATAKILAGAGDREKWAAMLTPGEYQQLRERIDIDFDPTNTEFFDADAKVALKLHLKNVDSLIVRIFEINTENYYREFRREIDTDINLDGLVANHELTLEYSQSPFVRHAETFTLDSIDKRGVYVVDFVGGGKSSRALIRKGRLQMIGRVTVAGQRFEVIDSQGEKVNDASLWISGRRYTADDDGHIDVPFSSQPSRQMAIISQGDFSSLQAFDQVSEKYQLATAFYVDRESLVRSGKATVIVRPSLSVAGGHRVPLARLKKAILDISMESLDGVVSSLTVDNVELSEKQETAIGFIVPPRLKSVTFTLRAELFDLVHKRVNLSARQSFGVNAIDLTDQIADVHLAPSSDGWFLEVVGKTGEARSGLAVAVQLKSEGLRDAVKVNLQSDAAGLVKLGALEHIESLTAKLADGNARTWSLRSPGQQLASNIHLTAGEPLMLARPEGMDDFSFRNISLFEMRGGRPVRDCRDLLEIEGYRIVADLDSGDYRMELRSHRLAANHRTINIRVSAGQSIGGAIAGPHRVLQKKSVSTPAIVSATVEDDNLVVSLDRVSKNTRVHVFTSRYQSAFDPFANLAAIGSTEPWRYSPSVRRSAYVQGRTLGEELQYILDRRYRKRFPGNMLQRPSLLLNPWAVRKTDNDNQTAASGDKFADSGVERDGKRTASKPVSATTFSNLDFANLDFLGMGEPALLNLKPDAEGHVRLTRDQIGDAQKITIVAVNESAVTTSSVTLPLSKLNPVDYRLADGLAPDAHFNQSKQTRVLAKGETLTIKDLASSKFAQYDELSDVFELFTGMGNDGAALKKFAFILQWSTLEKEQKQTLYSQHACHELNFFLFQRDRDFFDAVVKPHLQHKREATFLDRWLLEDDLTEFLSPWKYARLNPVERILLAQALGGDQRASIVRELEESYAVNPLPRETAERVYFFALNGLAISGKRADASRDLMRRQAGRELEETPLPALAVPRSMPAPGGMAGMGGGGMDDGFGAIGGSTTFGIPDADSFLKKKRLRNRPSKSRSGEMSKEESDRGRSDSTIDFDDISGDDSLELILEEQNEILIAKDAERAESLYRRIDPTMEYMEHNYWHLLPEQTTSDRVALIPFWVDYARHTDGDFLSPHFAQSNRNFTEMMFALAVLDLPLGEVEDAADYADGAMTLTAVSPTILLYQQNEATRFQDGATKLLVNENFFRKNDRYRFEDSVRYDNFIRDEFQSQALIGAQVVVTNPTSTPMTVALLTQIPRGSLPAAGSHVTRTVEFDLPAFATETFEYAFYFPTAGEFSHYPAHLSSDGNVVAVAEAISFTVTDEAAQADRQSWAWVSQNGDADEVIEFLKRENIARLDLSKIAFRMKDKSFFSDAIATIGQRRAFDDLLWSYSIQHGDTAKIAEYLQQSKISNQIGYGIDSPILQVDAAGRDWYHHREYWPLVNSRRHQLGAQRKILNSRFFEQYQSMLEVLSHKPRLTSDDHLEVTYYMLLQDREETAMAHFDNVEMAEVNSAMQYDYCDAYLDLYRSDPDAALAKAEKWSNYPVDHWRNRFENVIAMVREIRGEAGGIVDLENRDQRQAALATAAESIDFTMESGTGSVRHQNVSQLTINYYQMDIELLFSRNPFSRDSLSGFSLIRPNMTQQVEVSADDDKPYQFDLPAEFRNRNVLIEVEAGEQSKMLPSFANALQVQVVESYGQLRVTEDGTEKAIDSAYVKVYAKDASGQIRFHKDGYTDLRGRFDYVTQSNQSIDAIKEYSILIMSPESGAVIRDAKPPLE